MEETSIGKLIDDELRMRAIEDLKLLTEDAKDVLRNTSDLAGKRLHEARAQMASTMTSAREQFSAAEKRLAESARSAVETTDAYVQQHPWQAVGAGILAGVALGLLLGRSR